VQRLRIRPEFSQLLEGRKTRSIRNKIKAVTARTARGKKTRSSCYPERVDGGSSRRTPLCRFPCRKKSRPGSLTTTGTAQAGESTRALGGGPEEADLRRQGLPRPQGNGSSSGHRRAREGKKGCSADKKRKKRKNRETSNNDQERRSESRRGLQEGKNAGFK